MKMIQFSLRKPTAVSLAAPRRTPSRFVIRALAVSCLSGLMVVAAQAGTITSYMSGNTNVIGAYYFVGTNNTATTYPCQNIATKKDATCGSITMASGTLVSVRGPTGTINAIPQTDAGKEGLSYTITGVVNTCKSEQMQITSNPVMWAYYYQCTFTMPSGNVSVTL